MDSYSSGRALPVDVAAIERELARLWKEAAESASREGVPVTRTCLLNLVVLAEAGRNTDEISSSLAEFYRERPCRILLLEVDEAGRGEAVDALVSAHCQRSREGERHVCCEQVTLRASAEGALHLPALSAALTASDLPVFLYLPHSPPGDADLPARIAAGVDKVVFDGATLQPGGRADLARRLRTRARPALADLEWGRLLPFRACTAAIFDSPLLQPLLDRVTAVETFGPSGCTPGARLLEGWVKCVLSGRRIGALHSANQGSAGTSLDRLVIRAGDDESIIVERSGTAGLFSARVELPGTCPLPLRRRYPDRSVAELLCEALDRSAEDPLFAEALRIASAGS